MELKAQKRIAARILKCGVSRVWIDPAKLGDVYSAIMAQDIRNLIKQGVIKELPKKGLSTGRKNKMASQKRKGRRSGHGSRKGKAGARFSRKRAWINRVRAQRSLLRELRKSEKIDQITFKDAYKKSKGGFFRSRSHLLSYLGIEKEK